MIHGKEMRSLENRALVTECLKLVPDYFLLIALAGRRAHELSSGSAPLVEAGKHKDSVTALQEIALEKISPETLKESLVESFQTYHSAL